MNLTKTSESKAFGGLHQQFSYASEVLNSETRFAIYLPPNASSSTPVPVLYWLSGLTCTDENFMQKAGAMRVAAELGMAIVTPDTSPRGGAVPDDPQGAYDLGLGAGFYVNATQAPWSTYYHMYDFVVSELPKVIEQHFPVNRIKSISGHSMGGHGALTIALKNAGEYCSVSAFAPIANPTQVPWGKKAFSQYLGEDESSWAQYDTCLLLKTFQNEPVPALVDQGEADNFLEEQLSTDTLKKMVEQVNYPMQIRLQAGYDHSYYFIASFIEEHLRFHAKYMELA
ncbi:S-formylglutathione hydrolase [Alteromonas sp. a30]|uniref:S-formylglutathione hydrolase n=1 Tax=Alteromonas sp. a30 TaxID=2730917 RepID=UPI0022809914|nr:S-formylglutathione hydrolase [Alteromonas sp. a30]MCY7295627.1 S-formylglutathione hydrolase [Alteromonas sp. a30]